MSARPPRLRLGILTFTLLLVVAGCTRDQPLVETVFFEGRGELGRVAYSQGPDWLDYGEFGCASCHGRYGAGRSVRAGKVIGSAPPITSAALSVRGYDRKGLRRALAEGMTPEGRSLNAYMPRWSMSHTELTALREFLADL